MSESQVNYLFTLKNAYLSSNSYNFWMQPNIPMKFAGYVAWILLCKHCKFGEKIYYTSRDTDFFLGDYFVFGAPCRLAGCPLILVLCFFQTCSSSWCKSKLFITSLATAMRPFSYIPLSDSVGLCHHIRLTSVSITFISTIFRLSVCQPSAQANQPGLWVCL